MQSIDKKSDLYATGLAIFAMFFGAGNIIFPLALGQQLFEQTYVATLGLLITAVLVPFSGLLAMFLYQGQIAPFFGRLGRWPGLALACLIIALLGPLGSTPRCIALSFSTLNLVYPGLNVTLFNGIACCCLFFMAYKKQRLLGVLGYFLTPLLLALLVFIVIKGIWDAPVIAALPSIQTEAHMNFWKGLKEGYNMMDLLAAFFFAPVIIHLTQAKTAQLPDAKSRLIFVLQASAIGGALLAMVYIGFSLLASLHATNLQGIPAEELLAAIALQVLGPHAGLIVCLTVVLACLTTAVALITAFARFIQQELLNGKGSYSWILIISLLVTYLIASFEFQGISKFLTPILEVCYPFLILLTGYNLIERLYHLRGIPQAIKAKRSEI